MLQFLLGKIRKNQSFAVVTGALLLVLGLTAVQQTEMLPLRGQSTPMYAPLSNTQKTEKKSVKSVKSSVRSSVKPKAHHAAPAKPSSRSSSVKKIKPAPVTR